MFLLLFLRLCTTLVPGCRCNDGAYIPMLCLLSPACLQLFPVVLQLSKAVADELQQAGPATTVNMERISRMLTSDVMGHMLFGMDLGGVSHDER